MAGDIPDFQPIFTGAFADNYTPGELAMISKLDWMRQKLYQLAEPCLEWWSFINRNKIDLKAVEPHCGGVAVALCKSYETVEGDRLFEFSSNGIPCAVIEAILFRREGDNINPYTADLIAWPLNSPDQFATVLTSGAGCELLGAWSAFRKDHTPLTIYQAPLAWLQGGCEGIVLLKPGAEHWLRKAGCPFVCDDTQHGSTIRELLGPAGRHHKILIPNSERKAA